jgi:glycerophosphoryl diester phosphodiesterase
MKYLQYDENGKILAFYAPEIHKNIPPNTIEITDEKWQECLENQHKRGVDIQTKKIIVITPSAPTIEQLLKKIRFKRNQLLAESDWTVLSDSPLTEDQKVKWKQYRQALRDFPATCDPYNPVWPIIPD